MIPFQKSEISVEDKKIACEIISGLSRFHGGGLIYDRCRALLKDCLAMEPYLTTSGTSALELALMYIRKVKGFGGKVILPSYTFSSCANAVIRAGLRPHFVDINELGLLDEAALLSALEDNDDIVAIMFVDYAGLKSYSENVLTLAASQAIFTLVDAAQAFGSPHWERQYESSRPDFVAFSFHDTKNFSAGEGGVLFANCSSELLDLEILEVIFEKGTNRTAFIRGAVDKYRWLDVGGSFICSDLNLAFLLPQLERRVARSRERAEITAGMADFVEDLRQSYEIKHYLNRGILTNGHFFWVVASDSPRVIQDAKSAGIEAVRHYVPLHSSPFMTEIYGASSFCDGVLPMTEEFGEGLVRFPTYNYQCLEAFAKFASL